MSVMASCISAAKSIFEDNLEISYSFTGWYDDFVAASYPAICLEPDFNLGVLDSGLAFNYDDTGKMSVYYVEQAPGNRDMTSFITKVDSIVDILKVHPQLDGVLNRGINITAKYMRRSMDDNIEFIAQIIIEGRNY